MHIFPFIIFLFHPLSGNHKNTPDLFSKIHFGQNDDWWEISIWVVRNEPGFACVKLYCTISKYTSAVCRIECKSCWGRQRRKRGERNSLRNVERNQTQKLTRRLRYRTQMLTMLKMFKANSTKRIEQIVSSSRLLFGSQAWVLFRCYVEVTHMGTGVCLKQRPVSSVSQPWHVFFTGECTELTKT